MDVLVLNKKLTLYPFRNFQNIYICKLFCPYLMNHFFFSERKHFSRNLNYSENVNYEIYLYNNLTKYNFVFLKKRNISNINSEKKADEKINDTIREDEIKEEETKKDKIKKDEIENKEIKKNEINKDSANKEVIKNNEIKNYEILNNVMQDNAFSNNEVDKIYYSFNKEEILNSVNYKNFTYYNFDPSLKTKKIQIYYNCEMYDMDRKIKKIKNFLLNGYPVDILLIYNTDNIINKSSKNKNKKFKQDKIEKNQNASINKITKFVETQKLKQTKYSLHIYIKINLILNHIKNISVVDQIFRHFKNKNHIILIKTYPK